MILQMKFAARINVGRKLGLTVEAMRALIEVLEHWEYRFGADSEAVEERLRMIARGRFDRAMDSETMTLFHGGFRRTSANERALKACAMFMIRSREVDRTRNTDEDDEHERREVTEAWRYLLGEARKRQLAGKYLFDEYEASEAGFREEILVIEQLERTLRWQLETERLQKEYEAVERLDARIW